MSDMDRKLEDPRDDELEQRLARAISSEVPDVFDRVLAKLDEPEEKRPVQSRPAAVRSWKPLMQRLSVLAASLVIVISGSFYYYNHMAVSSVVGLDVNPSIELSVNRGYRVLRADANNPEGQQVLGGMELKGSSVEVAVNAILGSMLRNGYDPETILLTVIDESPNNRRKLETVLSQGTDAGDSALIVQGFSRKQEARDIVEKYGVSPAKAHLIEAIHSARPEADLDELASRNITQLAYVVQNYEIELTETDIVPSPRAQNELSRDEALAIALKDAGVGQYRELKIERDFEDGYHVYEIEFEADGIEYEYDVDMRSGAIRRRSSERDSSGADPFTPPFTPPAGPPSSGPTDSAPATATSSVPSGGSGGSPGSSGATRRDDALAIALKDAGIAQYRDLEIEEDVENGRPVYEIRFDSSGVEYEYDIDRQTGEILKRSSERESGAADAPSVTPPAGPLSSGSPDSATAAPPSSAPSSGSGGSPGSSGEISRDEALAIALKDAGVSQYRDLEIEEDVENGRPVYEIRFDSSGVEYEYDVDRRNGEIVTRSTENDG